MEILQKINAQVRAVGLPLFAVSLTAVPRADTPVLLILHWHGFQKDPEPEPMLAPEVRAVPGSALQINERWSAMQTLDQAMLDAAWQLGAWDMQRDECRGCNTVGASEREAHECRQAFGDNPLMPEHEDHLIAEAPDRHEIMHLGARIGYVRWSFRPVAGGLWRALAEDDTLLPEGNREPPCPVPPEPSRGQRRGATRYRFGRINRIILP